MQTKILNWMMVGLLAGNMMLATGGMAQASTNIDEFVNLVAKRLETNGIITSAQADNVKSYLEDEYSDVDDVDEVIDALCEDDSLDELVDEGILTQTQADKAEAYLSDVLDETDNTNLSEEQFNTYVENVLDILVQNGIITEDEADDVQEYFDNKFDSVDIEGLNQDDLRTNIDEVLADLVDDDILTETQANTLLQTIFGTAAPGGNLMIPMQPNQDNRMPQNTNSFFNQDNRMPQNTNSFFNQNNRMPQNTNSFFNQNK